MLQTRVGLVDTTGTVETETMAAVAAALNVQVTRDLPQYWPVSATVAFLPDHRQIPQGVWPVLLVKTLPPDEGGFGATRNHQPFAKVIVTPDSDEWTVDASHETIEMLVDPGGNRLQPSTAIGFVDKEIRDAPGQFEYLLGVCDPCAADPFSYRIAGVSVSDFLTPHFYDLEAAPGVRYSFTGAIERPRQILRGGGIGWIDPVSNEVQQILWADPGRAPLERNLGLPDGPSLRGFVESRTHHLVREGRAAPSALARTKRQAYRHRLEEVARLRAEHYRCRSDADAPVTARPAGGYAAPAPIAGADPADGPCPASSTGFAFSISAASSPARSALRCSAISAPR